MPAFTFEKISPPGPRESDAPIPAKPRGRISQIIDRLAETRLKRALREERSEVHKDEAPAR